MLQNIHGNIKVKILFLMFGNIQCNISKHILSISLKYRSLYTISYHILLICVYTSKTNKICICNKKILTLYNHINAGI